ncbi:MAG TPA: hypothetical protein VHX12_08135, partial [Acidisoma sp.]|nr:hypothetical protein [Acidisoma sp.]
MVTALHRALLKYEDNLRRVTSLPADAPEWMREKWPQGGPYYEFIPDERLSRQVRHIADWIRSAMVNQESWLLNIDAQGKPVSLVKLGTMEAALNKANKAMTRGVSAPAAPAEGDTATVMTLSNGFQIVELLTPAALDHETALMGHCIGRGAYDAKL